MLFSNGDFHLVRPVVNSRKLYLLLLLFFFVQGVAGKVFFYFKVLKLESELVLFCFCFLYYGFQKLQVRVDLVLNNS